MNAPTATRHGDFARVLHAEWTKFRTVRSTHWTLTISTMVTVALGLTLLASILDSYDAMTFAERARFDPAEEGLWYHGLHLGQVMIGVLGVLLATSEYATGTIHPTLAAVPNRGRIIAAKALGFGALALTIGTVQAFTMFALAQPMLASRGLDVPLTDPVGLRGVGLAALSTAGIALLGLGTGLLLRHTAAAITTLMVVMLGLPIVGQFFPRDWTTVTKYLPADAAWAMFTPHGRTLDVWPATAVFLAYVAVLLAISAATFLGRDT